MRGRRGLGRELPGASRNRNSSEFPYSSMEPAVSATPLIVYRGPDSPHVPADTPSCEARSDNILPTSSGGCIAISSGGHSRQDGSALTSIPQTPSISGGSSDNGLFSKMGGFLVHQADLPRTLVFRTTPRIWRLRCDLQRGPLLTGRIGPDVHPATALYFMGGRPIMAFFQKWGLPRPSGRSPPGPGFPDDPPDLAAAL